MVGYDEEELGLQKGDFKKYFGNVRAFLQFYKLDSAIDNLALTNTYDNLRIDPVTSPVVFYNFNNLDAFIDFNEVFGWQSYNNFV